MVKGIESLINWIGLVGVRRSNFNFNAMEDKEKNFSFYIICDQTRQEVQTEGEA